jgi:two-component system, chemotaxis family, chemotaxis protein CheY
VSDALKNLRVLVVDDSQHMRAIVGSILRSAGITAIYEASHGGHALMLLANLPADVAIVDYQMSPMDGLEFTRRLRNPKTSPRPSLPIIMMTGYADRARVVAARRAGVSEFLVKPITAKGVLDRLAVTVLKPRLVVVAKAYVGPDRRRIERPQCGTPRRRASDAGVANRT